MQNGRAKPLQATSMRPQCDIEATSMRVASQAVATLKPPPCVYQATLMRPSCVHKAPTKRQQSHCGVNAECSMKNAEVNAKPATPAVIRSRPRRDMALMPFLPSAFFIPGLLTKSRMPLRHGYGVRRQGPPRRRFPRQQWFAEVADVRP